MSQRQFDQTGQISELVDRLSRQISSESRDSTETAVQRSLDDVASSEPFTAAAFLSEVDGSGVAGWTYRGSTGNDDPLLDQLSTRRPDVLDDLQQGQEPVQYPLGDLITEPSMPARCYFIGLPAGRLQDAPCSIGLLSRRQMNTDEMDRLASISRLLGLAAENARLHSLLPADHSGTPLASLIGLIAHELRTPLTGMRGNIQLALMSSQKGQVERVPDRLHAAITAVDNMTSLVQNLLDVSRMERGNFEIHPARADLRATASAAIEDALGGQDSAGGPIHLTDGHPVEHVHDQQTLVLALSYLLSSALCYRSSEDPVTITVSDQSDAHHIEINYLGSELSPADQLALAAPLYEGRPDPSSSHSRELSLALAYSRGVVLHHQGTISIQGNEDSSDEQSIILQFPADQPA